jgi:hypothetical protein
LSSATGAAAMEVDLVSFGLLWHRKPVTIGAPASVRPGKGW